MITNLEKYWNEIKKQSNKSKFDKAVPLEFYGTIEYLMDLDKEQLNNKTYLNILSDLYLADNEENRHLISDINIYKTDKHRVLEMELSEKNSMKKLSYQKFMNNANLVKNEFLMSYFIDNEYIQQHKYLKDGIEGENLTSDQTLIACEELLENTNFNPTAYLNVIEAEIKALKRFEKLLDDKIIKTNLESIYATLTVALRVFKRLNLEYIISRNVFTTKDIRKLVYTKKLTTYFTEHQEQTCKLALESKLLNGHQKGVLAYKFNPVFDDFDMNVRFKRYSAYAIDVCQKYNKMLESYVNNSFEARDSFVAANTNTSGGRKTYTDIMLAYKENAIEMARVNLKFLRNEILRTSTAEKTSDVEFDK